MSFSSVVGQQEIIEKLRSSILKDKVPHAQLFYGNLGNGGLALAHSLVKFLFCTHRSNVDSCDQCASCQRISEFKHPDVHVIFPVVQGISKTSSPLYSDWREITSKSMYFNLTDWIEKIDQKGRKPIISVEESKEILHKMTLKSYEGGYKVVLIWMAETMNNESSNKLLKLIEEPPEKTKFLLICENREKLLPTILSRTQQVFIPRIEDEEIYNYLIKNKKHPKDKAKILAKLIQGDLTQLHDERLSLEVNELHFKRFSSMMRVCFKKDVHAMLDWASDIATDTRDRQKQYLEYCLRICRESLRSNYLGAEMVQASEQEGAFLEKFSPYICEKNATDFMQLFDEAHYHVDRNVNSEIMFTQICFQTMRYIHKAQG